MLCNVVMYNHTELECKYVSVCGLALTCDFPPQYHPPRQIVYPSHPEKYPEGSLVYVHSAHLKTFITSSFPRVKNRIALLVNNDDNLFPYDYIPEIQEFLKSDRLLCMFVQNHLPMKMTMQKVFGIPIGIDYHTLNWEKVYDWGPGERSALVQERELLDVREQLLPLNHCAPRVVTNFQHSMSDPVRRRAIRQPIYEALKDSKIVEWLPKQTRDEFWLSLKDAAFVISPPGNGLDTHRTWEVLMLGRIPIISATPLNSIYEGLPVWEVNDWKEFAQLTPKDLQSKLEEIRSKQYDMSRLTLTWWQTFIRNKINEALSRVVETKRTMSYSLTTKDNYPIDWMVADVLHHYNLLYSSSTKFYVEAGANDGVTQSNTFFLQQKYGWRGLLVEPCRANYEKCCKVRSLDNICVQAALVNSDDIKMVTGDFQANQNGVDYTSLMNSVGGKRLGREMVAIEVPARSLTSLVREHNIEAIDFMSLDVEGYEYEVLQGIDLKASWAPKVFLIELYGFEYDSVRDLLQSSDYVLVKNLSGHDITKGHSDFLFVKRELCERYPM